MISAEAKAKLVEWLACEAGVERVAGRGYETKPGS